jgi:CRP-like cAMP-binding protein
VQTTETYSHGATIIQQGTTSRSFYVLEKGAVEIYIGDVLLNVIMYPGSIFGEVGFIRGTPRTGSIKARADTIVQRYDCASVEALIAHYPEIAAKMIETLASRLQRTTEKVSELT